MPTRDPHSMTIRAHLSMLAICAVLPVLAFAALVSVTLVEKEQRTLERGVIERARALMTAIDAQLRGSLAALHALSASRALAADDVRGFHESAVRVLAMQPDWYSITLALPSGKKLVDAREPFNAPLGDIVDWSSVQRLLDTQKPAIGDVANQTNGPPIMPIRLPVIRDGRVQYILTASVAVRSKAPTRSARFSARRSATGRSASPFRPISCSAPLGKPHGSLASPRWAPSLLLSRWRWVSETALCDR